MDTMVYRLILVNNIWWSTQSHALLRSMNVAIPTLLSSKDFKMSSLNFNRACSVLTLIESQIVRMIIYYLWRNSNRIYYKKKIINFTDSWQDGYWPVVCNVQFNFTFKYRQNFSSIEWLRENPWAKDLFIKFESIGAKIMTFVLSILVGMLSHRTLLLFFKFVMIFVSREWMFDENCLTLEFDRPGNFQMLLNYYLYYHSMCRNTIKIGIERICNCFRLSNVIAIEFNGGIDWTVFY